MPAAVRPESLSHQLPVMADTDQRDLLPRIAVPTLLIWGELDARSQVSVARQFEQAIPDTKLVVIPGSGHVSNLEQPEQFNEAVREFCRAGRRVRPEDARRPVVHAGSPRAGGVPPTLWRREGRSPAWCGERHARSRTNAGTSAPKPETLAKDGGCRSNPRRPFGWATVGGSLRNLAVVEGGVTAGGPFSGPRGGEPMTVKLAEVVGGHQ
jgi:Alpha/beta hydrolase family